MYETLGYIGIPLEVEMASASDFRDFQIYIKGGIQAGLKIHGNSWIKSYEDDITHEYEIFATTGIKPSNFLSTIYGAIGFRSFEYISVELVSPHFFLSKNNLSLLIPQTHFGIQFIISYPVDFSKRNKNPKKIHLYQDPIRDSRIRVSNP